LLKFVTRSLVGFFAEFPQILHEYSRITADEQVCFQFVISLCIAAPFLNKMTLKWQNRGGGLPSVISGDTEESHKGTLCIGDTDTYCGKPEKFHKGGFYDVRKRAMSKKIYIANIHKT